MGEIKKEKNESKLGLGKFIAWCCRDMSKSVQVVMMGFLTIYCTNALGMDAALVGVILMATKIFDGFTDLIAGYIVDNTNTKWGKGRPYEICIIGLWVATWLCFFVPESATLTVKCIWIVICYTVAQSICLTFLNANGTVYMVRAFANEKHFATLNSIGGLLCTAGVLVFNIIFPMFEAKIINSAPGWSRLVLCVAIPFAIIGFMRFLFVKETVDVDVALDTKVSFRDIIQILKTNRYIYPVAGITLIAAIWGGMNIGNYYYLYVVGNVALSGVMSVFGFLAIVTMALYPVLMKKLSIKQLIILGCAFAIPGGIITFFAKKNLVMLAIGSVLLGISTLPINYMSSLMIIDCALYNEYKGNKRMEGTLNSIVGFANKIGGALASFLVGILLSVAGFDGTLEVQLDSAIMMIRSLNGLAPIVFAAIIVLILSAYTLDKRKPEIEKTVKERREAARIEKKQATAKAE